MYVVGVNILVKPEFVNQFMEVALDNATNTRKEPGNIRFDVLRGDEEPNRFFLYEVYQSREDFVKHQQTPHYLRWKNVVGDWTAQPRVGVKYRPIFFGEQKV